MDATLYIEDEAAMLAFGTRLSTAVQPGTVVYLRGELGAGKTTLVRGFLRALGYCGAVKSPTYTLVESYLSGGQNIFHFDLYRLADPDELEYLGIRDYFDHSAICFVEWPERAAGMLPVPDLDIHIQYRNGGRALQLSAVNLQLINRIIS